MPDIDTIEQNVKEAQNSSPTDIVEEWITIIREQQTPDRKNKISN